MSSDSLLIWRKAWFEFDEKFFNSYDSFNSDYENHDVDGMCHKNWWGQRVYYDEMYGHADKTKKIMGFFAHGKKF